LDVNSQTEDDLPSPDKWLDVVAASMGLEAFDVITCAMESPDSALSGESRRVDTAASL
jgi:hypothetical protein